MTVKQKWSWPLPPTQNFVRIHDYFVNNDGTKFCMPLSWKVCCLWRKLILYYYRWRNDRVFLKNSSDAASGIFKNFKGAENGEDYRAPSCNCMENGQNFSKPQNDSTKLVFVAGSNLILQRNTQTRYATFLNLIGDIV